MGGRKGVALFFGGMLAGLRRFEFRSRIVCEFVRSLCSRCSVLYPILVGVLCWGLEASQSSLLRKPKFPRMRWENTLFLRQYTSGDFGIKKSVVRGCSCVLLLRSAHTTCTLDCATTTPSHRAHMHDTLK